MFKKTIAVMLLFPLLFGGCAGMEARKKIDNFFTPGDVVEYIESLGYTCTDATKMNPFGAEDLVFTMSNCDARPPNSAGGSGKFNVSINMLKNKGAFEPLIDYYKTHVLEGNKKDNFSAFMKYPFCVMVYGEALRGQLVYDMSEGVEGAVVYPGLSAGEIAQYRSAENKPELENKPAETAKQTSHEDDEFDWENPWFLGLAGAGCIGLIVLITFGALSLAGAM